MKKLFKNTLVVFGDCNYLCSGIIFNKHDMGKILDYIVKKGEGNYLCYKTNKVSLNISDTDVLDYDDKPASTRNKSRIAESDLSLVPTVVIDRMLIDYSRPIFRFFS